MSHKTRCSLIVAVIACSGPEPATEDPRPDASTVPGDAGEAACELTRPAMCGAIVGLPSTPIIDGKPECGMPLVEVEPQGWTNPNEPIPEDVSLSYAVAWHSEGLYFFVRVVDPDATPPPASMRNYCGDAVEIYVDDDSSYSNSPTYDTWGTRQFVISSDNRGEVYRDQVPQGDWSSIEYSVFITREGYDVEAIVRAQDLGVSDWSLTEGQQIGFNVGVNLGHTSPPGPTCNEQILGQFYLKLADGNSGAVCTAYPSCDVRAFCNARLMSGS